MLIQKSARTHIYNLDITSSYYVELFCRFSFCPHINSKSTNTTGFCPSVQCPTLVYTFIGTLFRFGLKLSSMTWYIGEVLSLPSYSSKVTGQYNCRHVQIVKITDTVLFNRLMITLIGYIIKHNSILLCYIFWAPVSTCLPGCIARLNTWLPVSP